MSWSEDKSVSLVIHVEGTQLTIDLVFVLTEDDSWWGRLLQTFQKVDHFRLLFNVFDHLQDVQIGSTSTADVYEDGLDE